METKIFVRSKKFITNWEAAIALFLTGTLELIQFFFDIIPLIGWVINFFISGLEGLIFAYWVHNKVSKGAPKNWYKAIYYGFAGGALPVLPGFFASTIWLIIKDKRQR